MKNKEIKIKRILKQIDRIQKALLLARAYHNNTDTLEYILSAYNQKLNHYNQ